MNFKILMIIPLILITVPYFTSAQEGWIPIFNDTAGDVMDILTMQTVDDPAIDIINGSMYYDGDLHISIRFASSVEKLGSAIYAINITQESTGKNYTISYHSGNTVMEDENGNTYPVEVNIHDQYLVITLPSTSIPEGRLKFIAYTIRLEGLIPVHQDYSPMWDFVAGDINLTLSASPDFIECVNGTQNYVNLTLGGNFWGEVVIHSTAPAGIEVSIPDMYMKSGDTIKVRVSINGINPGMYTVVFSATGGNIEVNCSLQIRVLPEFHISAGIDGDRIHPGEDFMLYVDTVLNVPSVVVIISPPDGITLSSTLVAINGTGKTVVPGHVSEKIDPGTYSIKIHAQGREERKIIELSLTVHGWDVIPSINLITVNGEEELSISVIVYNNGTDTMVGAILTVGYVDLDDRRYILLTEKISLDPGATITLPVNHSITGRERKVFAELKWNDVRAYRETNISVLGTSYNRTANESNAYKNDSLNENSSDMFIQYIIAILVAVILIPVFVYLRRGGSKIDDIFVIYSDGRLIYHYTRKLRPDVDSYVLSGILTAIMDFAQTAVGEGNEGFIMIGNYLFYVIKKDPIIVAARVENTKNKHTRKVVERIYDEIIKEYSSILDGWDGDPARFSNMDGTIDRALKRFPW